VIAECRQLGNDFTMATIIPQKSGLSGGYRIKMPGACIIRRGALRAAHIRAESGVDAIIKARYLSGLLLNKIKQAGNRI